MCVHVWMPEVDIRYLSESSSLLFLAPHIVLSLASLIQIGWLVRKPQESFWLHFSCLHCYPFTFLFVLTFAILLHILFWAPVIPLPHCHKKELCKMKSDYSLSCFFLKPAMASCRTCNNLKLTFLAFEAFYSQTHAYFTVLHLGPLQWPSCCPLLRLLSSLHL